MHTDRLLIRRFTEDDWPDIYEYLSDPQVVKYEPYLPLNESECETLARHHSGSEAFWAICLADGSKLIGHVYLEEKNQRCWELGYVFNPAYHCMGYATEAVLELMEYAFAECGAHRIFARCNPENATSWQLLERVGMRREGHLIKDYYFNISKFGQPLWQDTYIYALLEEEWGR